MSLPVDSRDHERLTLLVRSGEIFHQSLDVTATLHNVARLAVESFADLCLFDLLDEQSERVFVTASAHRDPSRAQDLAATVSTILYVQEFGVHPVVQVARTGIPLFLPHIDEETLAKHAASRQHEHYMRRFGYRSKIVVPVTIQGHLFGALTFVRTSEGHAFDEGDLTLALELGRRAGLAVANAKQFRREQYVAETLQRAFLPSRFPSRDGLRFHAHYRPGSTEADIGGDWYDAFENADGEIVAAIGDVTGKGIEAARLMVLLRQAIRVAALDLRDPAKIADACNRLLLAESGNAFASTFIGILEPTTRKLRYVSAGHPPPLLRLSDQSIRRLHAPSPPLGAFREVHFETHQIDCPLDSMLVLYTDGVIEVSRDVAAGEEMLERIVASNAIGYVANPAAFIEQVVDEAPRDDMAIMIINFSQTTTCRQFDAADARAAYSMRAEYIQCLSDFCEPTQQELSVCELLFAELVGNAVRHAPGPLAISLEQSADNMILHLIDKGPGFHFQPTLPADIWTEGGRGLYLIATFAREVRLERLPGMGSHIMVTLPISRTRRSLERAS